MMIPLIPPYPTVILANGAFPEHAVPLKKLYEAERIIACDGAVEALLEIGREPDYIVGDLDSLSPLLRERYTDRLHHDSDQETNDLTKAIHFAVKNGWSRIAILGASGKREDHCLGNISLLADYAALVEVCMLTDYGVFVPIHQSSVFESFPFQQVSIFTITPSTLLTTHRLTYSLKEATLTSWWQGTLNEAQETSFRIEMDRGSIIVFRTYEGKEINARN